MSSNIIIQKGRHPVRGFLSYYISILTSFRQLIEKEKVHPDRIKVDPEIFYTYANASHWFDDKVLSSFGQYDIPFDSAGSWDLSPWATKEELDLLKYTKYVPYNQHLVQYISTNLPDLDKAIGIHFRGTDHYHTDRVEVEKYVEFVEKEWATGKYTKVFIATDELFVIDKFKEMLSCKNIISNDTIKTIGQTALFDIPSDEQQKIRMGFEVMLDAHSLSNCDIVFGKLSNVTYYSRILKPELNVVYLDEGSEVR
jgi:hypothetical protein